MTDAEQLDEKIKHANGKDCKCEAWTYLECGCGADWTQSQVYEFQKEILGYKAQVAGQAKYIECLLAEVRELNERIQEFVK